LPGAAWVFTRSNGVWTQQGNKLVGSGALTAASRGTSVALSADGNTALLGGPHERRFRELRQNARRWAKNIIVRPVETQTVEIISMPPPEHKPTSSSPERKRELGRQRVARFRARQKVRRATAEGKCNADDVTHEA
jgi:hypothetical protein